MGPTTAARQIKSKFEALASAAAQLSNHERLHLLPETSHSAFIQDAFRVALAEPLAFRVLVSKPK